MRKNIVIIFACLLTGILTVPAATNGKAAVHPIDASQAACLKKAKGTMPRAKCYSDAAESWEKDVTKTYAAVLKALPSDCRSVFETSQSAWEKYRDAEFEVIAKMYNSRKGTGYISVRILLRMNIVKQRALLLEDWLASPNH
ncbi:MAG TPA: lysozyme inhibitor LprI family protein [Pyrinomonadaceae bacterium]|nr:lysozyme inhibitor LprI family protein [Pyrinomonadaceae bacterium]